MKRYSILPIHVTSIIHIRPISLFTAPSLRPLFLRVRGMSQTTVAKEGITCLDLENLMALEVAGHTLDVKEGYDHKMAHMS